MVYYMLFVTNLLCIYASYFIQSKYSLIRDIPTNLKHLACCTNWKGKEHFLAPHCLFWNLHQVLA